ncbi:hypothetical protein COBT_002788 [Conglomerata obtusa]
MVRPNFSKRSRVPKRPFDKDRLIDEMKLVGHFGLKNKRELWIVQKDTDKIKEKARDLLINSHEQEVIVQGRNLLNKLVRRGILKDVDLCSKADIIENLNKVLNLTASDFLERRLQYRVFEMGIADNVHAARCLIVQKQISVKENVVDQPGYEVGCDDEAFVELYVHGSKVGARKGRGSKKNKNKDAYEEGDEE